MRLLPLLRSLAFGVILGTAGWRGAEYLLRERRPARLLERAVAVAHANPASGLTAVLIFRPSECPQVMGIVDLLNTMAGSKVRVVGALTVEEYRMPDWRAVVGAQRIQFPVFRLDPAKAQASLSSLGYPGGPLLIVFDRDGRVLLATDALGQRGMAQFLNAVVQRFTATESRRSRA